MVEGPLTQGELDLVIPGALYDSLHHHLFPGDGDEHGAVILAGVAKTARGTRLLARELHLARDGVDYVAGKRGYRRLKGEFITPLITRARDLRLVYLAVHNHGGHDRVEFSSADLASHERGYRSLLDVAQGMPVGALVLAKKALAGDIWLSKSARVRVRQTVILGGGRRIIGPAPAIQESWGSPVFDRQELLFGADGQAILSAAKVGIIGLGGAGSQLATFLAKLGVGLFVLCDFDRLDISNIPRVDGASLWRALALFQHERLPIWVRELAKGWAIQKVSLAAENIRHANPQAKIECLPIDFFTKEAAAHFADCDYIFLAADSHRARLLFNALVHQYLIPGVQVGAKITACKDSGKLEFLYSVVRPVMPDHGCLWCNGLINSAKLQDEFASESQRVAQNYGLGEDVVAPSVNTLNATATATAANDFMIWYTGLGGSAPSPHYSRFTPLNRMAIWEEPRKDPNCPECNAIEFGRFAMGDNGSLPGPV